MSVKTVRRVAAKILKVGESRVKMKPEQIKRVNEALTTDDVRGLVSEGIVWAEGARGVSRAGARIRHEKQQKGRRGGSGSRKGAKYAKVTKKDIWKAKTRLQRATLKRMREEGKMVDGVYRKAYRMIKGNAWRSKAAMMLHFTDAKWLKAASAEKADGARKKAADKKAAVASKKATPKKPAQTGKAKAAEKK